VLKLAKTNQGLDWASVDDSAKKVKAQQEERMVQNKGKSTAQLLSEMYRDADEEGKEKLAQAWEAGRAKREGQRLQTT